MALSNIFVEDSVEYFKACLKLKTQPTFLYSNRWLAITDECVEIPGTERYDIDYDGDAHEVFVGRQKRRHVRVFINDNLSYPYQVGFFPGNNRKQYLRYISR